MPARYHLRFQLHPGPDAAAQAAELAKFCGEAGVDEVVLLLGAEELYAGHPAGAAEDLLVETAATGLAVLREAGLEVSLNPWVTTGHADRGRADRLGFAPMVAPDGTVAAAQASFACPRWRAWIAAHYGRFAALGFRVLWLEDDFRYHNHAPLPWGGGFEPPMLDRFAERVGGPVTREEVLAAVAAPGAPHPWRALLQQVWRTAQLEVAAAVADAVAVESGGRSRLGLMSSTLGVASVEGRDWARLFDALSVGGRAAHRPHFAPYSDAPGRGLALSVWMLEQQRALRPSWVTSEPEIENWPHTTWSKSDTQTWSELVAAQLAGSDALFLNLHPMHSGRAQRFPRIAELLRRSRPALDAVASGCSDGAFETVGVGLPFRQDAAAHVRARPGEGMAGLAVDPGPAAEFLLRYGVPVTAGPARVNCLFGQLAWAFTDEELRQLLGDGLLLDGVAAAILTERGFGALIGLAATELVERERHPTVSGPYAIELVPSEQGDIWLSVNTQPSLARLVPLPETEVTTRITTPTGEAWGPGRLRFGNALGGRVAILAATAPEQLPFDDDGQALLHATVRYLEGEQPALPFVSGGPHLVPQLVRTASGHRLAVANGSSDAARVHVGFPGDAPATARATLLSPLAEPAPAPAPADGPVIGCDVTLPHRAWLLLEWS